MTSLRKLGLIALVVALGMSSCAEGDGVTDRAPTDPYSFPTELLAAEAALDAAAAATTTTIPPLATPQPVEPPPPRAAAEALNAGGRPLPLPSSALLPEVGRVEPSIVTQDGERRLLTEVSVEVAYDPTEGFVVDPAGWWVVNYPLERIRGTEGRSADEIATTLLGRPVAEVSNYYFYTAPDSGATSEQVGEATGPAPVRSTPRPTFVVNNQAADASDENPGSRSQPLLTIGEAVSRAVPGSVIHVYPGVYREAVVVDQDGTADSPIRIEGIRGASGAMPVITGNDLFPAGSWEEVDGLRGVYRSEAFADYPGTLSVSGDALVERSAPWDLEPGEFVVTSGGDAFVDPRFDGGVRAQEGTTFDFGSSQYIWQVKETDGGGFVDLGTEFGEDFEGGVYWGSAWVWVERPDVVEDHQWYGNYDFDLQVSGPFRAGRVSGLALAEQPYEYRVWLDGQLLAGAIRSDAGNDEAEWAHPEIGRGIFGETWHGMAMREGWHQLVFQWDTTGGVGSESTPPLFRFGIPTVAGTTVTSAAKPPNQRRPRDGEPQNYVSEYMVLGPVPSSPDPSVYVRLPDDADPNEATVDMAARTGPVVSILGDFVELRGFEVRHGAQAEGEGLLAIGRRTEEPEDSVFVQGAIVEGNLVVGGEHTGIDVAVEGDQGVQPIVVRNNWIVDSGAVGIAAEGSSSRLTAPTLNDWAPGRTSVVVSDNRIINSGWAGYERTEQASILFTRMAGSSISRNTIIGGGPGITLAIENYGVRIDGNRVVDPWGWGIGVEANPGPNLVVNNVVTGLRAGPEWKRAHLLTWDSDQTWIINNTTDGEWGSESGWYGDIGSWGAAGPENFIRIEYDTWEMEYFRRVYLNNLFVGSFLGGIADYEGNWGESDVFDSNYREVPPADPFEYLVDGAEKANVNGAFVDRAGGDYRLRSSTELSSLGTLNRTSEMATHDFYGLLRHLDEATPVGAFRVEPSIDPGTSVIEVEFADGDVIRIGG